MAMGEATGLHVGRSARETRDRRENMRERARMSEERVGGEKIKGIRV